MKVLLDIKDSQADSLLAVLRGLPYVKTQLLSGEKAKPHSEEKQTISNDLKEAIGEVKLHKEGKIKLKSFDEFLNEL